MTRIRDSIEDRAIQKSNIKADLTSRTEKIFCDINPQIQQLKDSVADFRKMAMHHLPGLHDRITRYNNQQFYIHHILPKKSNKMRRRK